MYVVMTPSFLPFLSLTILSSHAFARKPHFITNSQKKGVSSARISRGSRLSVIAGFVSHVSGFRRLSVWIRLRRCNKLQVLSFPPFPLGQEKFFLHLIRREEEKLFLFSTLSCLYVFLLECLFLRAKEDICSSAFPALQRRIRFIPVPP